MREETIKFFRYIDMGLGYYLLNKCHVLVNPLTYCDRCQPVRYIYVYSEARRYRREKELVKLLIFTKREEIKSTEIGIDS